jgi:hypothetical protein
MGSCAPLSSGINFENLKICEVSTLIPSKDGFLHGGEDSSSNTQLSNGVPLEWATRPMKRLEEVMGVSLDGTKQEAVELFSSIKDSVAKRILPIGVL